MGGVPGQQRGVTVRRLGGDRIEILRHGAVAARKALDTMAAAKASERAAAAHRESDPAERAKAWLRTRGYIVHSAAVTGGRADRIVVGRRVMTVDAMKALAARLGFEG
jgi:antitoxin component HigA of HigAB toxin-antitoxin module